MSAMTYLHSLGSKSEEDFPGMLHTQNEEDSAAGRGVGGDFFQVLPENNRECSPGLFPQEVRKEIPTFAQKKS